jgi:hypothetical protein
MHHLLQSQHHIALPVLVLEGALVHEDQLVCLVARLLHPLEELESLLVALSGENPGYALACVTHGPDEPIYGCCIHITLQPKSNVFLKLVQVAVGRARNVLSDHLLLIFCPWRWPSSPLIACNSEVIIPLRNDLADGPLAASAGLPKLFSNLLRAQTMALMLLDDDVSGCRGDKDASRHFASSHDPRASQAASSSAAAGHTAEMNPCSRQPQPNLNVQVNSPTAANGKIASPPNLSGQLKRKELYEPAFPRLYHDHAHLCMHTRGHDSAYVCIHAWA